jgi:hypothetical protein
MAGNKSKKGGSSTSRSREESMKDSGEDEFARRGATRNPDKAGKTGRAKSGDESHQSPRDSGTTGLGGETAGSESIRGPGGVEGSSGSE